MVGRGVVPVQVGCGGTELAMFQLGKAIGQAGHKVTLVADVVEGDFPDNGRAARPSRSTVACSVAASRLPNGFAGWIVKHFAGNVASALRARRLLRTESFDLVHTHGNLAALLLSYFTSVPIVYTEHDSTPWSCRYRTWHERLVRRLIYRAINVQCLPTRHDGRDNVGGTPRGAARAVRGGGDAGDNDLERRRHRPLQFGRRALRHTAPFEHYCLFVGRLTPRKAPDLLLEALVEAPRVNCVFAGDGPERKKLEQLAVELGVTARVAFLGDISPQLLAPLYAGADLLVIPSFSEGTPLVAFEAMACGTPVLSSRVAGLPDVVHDWSTGFLVKPGDVGQMAVAMRFLTADRPALERMGSEAQQPRAQALLSGRTSRAST